MGNNIHDNAINGQNDIFHLQDASNRPISYYDNTLSELTSVHTSTSSPSNDLSRNESSRCDRTQTPSQMDCLITTVPQNIASQNIAGKHAPTRNSLRHSRMIVLNRSGNVAYLPAVVRHYKFIKSLLILITFSGTVLCALSMLLLLWSPNVRSRDNTYWSAIPVVFSGVIGLIYLCFVPKKPAVNRLAYWTKSLKVISTSISAVAAAACFIMCFFTVLHTVALSTMTCAPPNKVNTSCVCEPDSISLFEKYHYVDLSCTDVNNMLYIIIIPTCIINAVIGVCEVLYLYIQWRKRTSYVYTTVPTKAAVNNNSEPGTTTDRQ